MEKRKHGAVGVLALLVVLSTVLASCASPAAAPVEVEVTRVVAPTAVPTPSGPQVGGTLHVIHSAGFFSMDASTRPDSDTLSVRYNIYDSLVTWDKDWQVVPQVATNWEVSDDGLTWTFHLRDDVYFHDGSPLNAEAVKFSMEREFDPELYKGNNPLKAQCFVESVTVIDEYTVAIKTSKPAPLLLGTLAHGDGQIVSPTSVAEWGDDAQNHSLGSGPYKFVSWVRGGELILERNENYWLDCGEGGPCFDRIVYRVVPEESARTTLLLTGEADVVARIPPQDVYLFEDPEAVGATLIRTEAPRTMAMRMNSLHGPFDKLDARMAMQYAIDKQGVIDSVMSGAGVIASSAQPRVTTHWVDQGAYPFDAAKAKQMLEAAGYDFTHVVKMVCPQGKFVRDSQICEAVQGQLEQNLGIDVELEIVPDFPTYLTMIDMESGYYWDMALDGVYSANPAPDSMIECGFNGARAGHICNFNGFKQDAFDVALNAAMSTVDETARGEYYAEMQKILWQEVPWIFLWYEVSFDGYRNNLENVYVLPMQRPVVRGGWFK